MSGHYFARCATKNDVMKNLYDPAVLQEIVQRVDSLSASNTRQWGKMETAQMLAHCTVALEAAANKSHPPRVFIGYILGPLFRSQFYNDRPFNRNGPTHPQFRISDQRELEKEKQRLKTIATEFSQAGPAACTTDPHAFFGKLTAEQWGIGMYKHLDHHLRQFSA